LVGEIALVKQLFPSAKDYTDVYDRFGLHSPLLGMFKSARGVRLFCTDCPLRASRTNRLPNADARTREHGDNPRQRTEVHGRVWQNPVLLVGEVSGNTSDEVAPRQRVRGVERDERTGDAVNHLEEKKPCDRRGCRDRCERGHTCGSFAILRDNAADDGQSRGHGEDRVAGVEPGKYGQRRSNRRQGAWLPRASIHQWQQRHHEQNRAEAVGKHRRGVKEKWHAHRDRRPAEPARRRVAGETKRDQPHERAGRRRDDDELGDDPSITGQRVAGPDVRVAGSSARRAGNHSCEA